MIERDASLALRLQFAIAVFGFAVLGVLGAWLGIATLAHTLQRSAEHVPLIAFRPLYVTGLPLAVAFFALAVLALLPKETMTRKPARRRRMRATHVAFGVMVGSILLAIVTTSLATVAMTEVMHRRGYSDCPASDTGRRAPMRWVRDGGRCP